ncbi:hypothetical protein CLV62_103159 [Dysgonomonas alginatilytica]|uniref:DUF5362 domain-containing protein n=1 Tax=Dysgonomonas alginatilytica TaxID=1605892 RepID=A0A2V3PRT2_9BACT|nr:hypothetical protein [Dysgonomonas alginatilytica]PXV67486.1 hypothetical protein CLV62_103159 [Dysgonomonas alginatilytica]
MENNYSTQESDQKSLELTDLSFDFLKETAKWAKFLSILGFIGIALMVIFAIFIGVFLSMLSASFTQSSPFAVAPGLFSLIYLVLAALYACPVYFLYKFSINTRDALNARNSDLLTEGLRYLKSHYKFIGIMMIVLFALYIVVIIGAIVVGIAAATLS